MHEMSLAEGVRGIVEEAARARGFATVRTVVLEIGELASVEVEALRFCLDVVLRDSVAEGARVEVETIAGTGRCRKCARTVGIANLYDACPACGGCPVQPTGGTGMRVKELEVD
jgi:hydrogenase nickel incorporation protein HypA/HybF